MVIKTLPLDLTKQVFPDSHPVAQRLDGTLVHWQEASQKIAYWKRQLKGIKRKKVVVYHNDSLEFMCILLSIWQMEKIAVVPANTLETMQRAVSSQTDVFLGEFVTDHIAKPLAETPNGPGQALIIYTSGSSGAPLAISKTFAQINAELKMLHRKWGDTLTQTSVAGTVSHHHMFGLPFRLLWPLVSGRVFLNQKLGHLEQLQKVVRKNTVIVSSPAHLEHLPPNMDWAGIRQQVAAVFSAGAPLSDPGALDTQEKLGVPVTEIYGSTETGAVAWRNRGAHEHWQALEGVSIKSSSGRLAILSPAALDEDWYISEDLCEILPGEQFSLGGRVDKIVKVGGRRISLTAVENALKKQPLVAHARVLLLPRRKSRIGAVVQLNTQGNLYLVDKGKLKVSRQLAAVLRNKVERVAWPRYWRFVSVMPVDAQGKTSLLELELLFADEPSPTLPKILEQCVDNKSGEQITRFEVPASLLYLKGHFPGRPILPGVVQISWAMHFGKALSERQGQFKGMEAIKFQQVIQPGDSISLGLRWDDRTHKLSFRFFSRDKSYSSGRIAFYGEG